MTSQTQKTKAKGPLMKTAMMKTPMTKTTSVLKTTTVTKSSPAVDVMPVSRPKPTQVSPASKIARRDRIVLEHSPLVKAITVRVHENLPVHVDLNDLVHARV